MITASVPPGGTGPEKGCAERGASLTVGTLSRSSSGAWERLLVAVFRLAKSSLMPVTAGLVGASVEMDVTGLGAEMELDCLGKGCILRP